MKNKVCSKCKLLKLSSEFGRNRSTSDQLQKYCRQCRKISDYNHYQRNKIQCYGRVAKRRMEIAAWFRSIKKSSYCLDCGNSDPWVLDFHHLSKKSKDISTMVCQGYSIKAIEAEMSKCIVLCANCHRKRHQKLSHSASFCEEAKVA